MSTYKARTKNALRNRISNAKLLSTSALTAISLVALSSNAAMAVDVDPNKDWDSATIVAGDADVIDAGLGLTHINQHTMRAVGEIGDASIGANAVVTIFQNGTGDLFVMRDTAGNDPTQILGTLRTRLKGSNSVGGSTMVLDTNGVIFGANSVVDMTSIAVSTGQLSNADIMDGNGNFEFSNFGDGAIELNGTINVAEAGLAAFVSPTVINNGVINAKMGTVVFAAGETVTLDLYGDGLVELAVEGELADALLENKGTIDAAGGTVQMSAVAAKGAVDNIINVEGVVTVASATQSGGKIILSGGNAGAVSVKGKLDASGATEGGDINVTGETIEVAGGAVIENNGDSSNTYLFGNKQTNFHGSLAAGTNAQAEISGKNLNIDGASVLLGDGSQISFDPDDFIVNAANVGTFTGLMGGGNVTVDIEAKNTIRLDTDIDTTGQTTTSTLNFKDEDANNDLQVNLYGSINLAATQNLTGDATQVNVANGALIQNAVDIASVANGATIDVADGIFAENVIINKDNIILNGEQAGVDGYLRTGINETFLQGRINTAGTNVTIDGFTIENQSDASTVSINSGARNVNVLNNKFDGKNIAGARGLDTANNVDGVIARGNNFTGLTLASRVRPGGDNIDIRANNFEDNHSAIQVVDGDGGVTIRGNRLTDNQIGIRISGTGTVDQISNNRFRDNVNHIVYLNGAGQDLDLGPTNPNLFWYDGAFKTTLDLSREQLFDVENHIRHKMDNGAYGIVEILTDNLFATSSNLGIQHGVDIASVGDTINVDAGTWTESIDINKAVNLVGSGVGSTIMNPAGANAFSITDDLGAANSVTIDGFTVDGASNSGVRFANSATLGTLSVLNSEFNNNGFAGVIIGGSYTDVNLSNLIIQDTNFNNNGGVGPAVRGDGDIVAFFYNGDATLKNIIINNDGAAAGIEPDYGIQFRGRADTAAWPPVNPAAMGTVSFDNVKVAGDYRAAQIGIQGYADTSNLSFNDVTLGGLTTNGVTSEGWTSLYLSLVGTNDLNLGNMNFLGGNMRYIDNISAGNIDATGATFDETDNFAIEDRIAHKMDDTRLGLVTWVENELFVTKFTAGIQNAINIATAGDTVNVNGETYKEDLTIDKALKLTGHGTTLESNGAANLITVTAAGVNIDPFNFDGLGIANYGVHADGANGLIVDGNNFTGFLKASVSVNNSSGARVYGNTTTGGEKGIVADNAANIWIYNNDINDATVAGVHLKNTNGTNYANDADIWYNRIDSAATATGVLVENSNYATVGAHLTRQPNADDALNGNTITGGADGVVISASNNTMVRHNIIENTASNGIKITGANNGFVQNNQITNAGFNGIAVIDSSNVTINSDNIIDGTFAAGITLNRTTSSLVDGNDISNTGGSGVWINKAHKSTVSNNDIDTTWLNASRSTGAGVYVKDTNGATVSGNTIDNVTRDGAGIDVTNAGGVQITDNFIGTNGAADNISGDGIVVTGNENTTISGNEIANVGNDGVRFADEQNGVTVEITGNTITTDNANGIAFDAETSISGGSTVTIADNTINADDDGVDVNGATTGAGTNLIIAGNTITAGNDGLDISAVKNGASVTIGGMGAYDDPATPAEFRGNRITADDDGIEFDAGIDAFVSIESNRISAGSDGIAIEDQKPGNVTGVSSNATVQIMGNQIGSEGSDRVGDDGIDFDDAITGKSTVTIAGNTIGRSRRYAGDNGIEFDSIEGGATVNITNNPSIRTFDNGIHVGGKIENATLNITGNNHGIHAGQHGIYFGDEVTSNAKVNIHDNIISANEDSRDGIGGNGIHFNDEVNANADVNIGNGSGGTQNVGGSNVINGYNGIVFNDDIYNSASVDIDGNRIGFDADAFTGPYSNDRLSANGIKFSNIYDSAEIIITDNHIRAGEDGVQFDGQVYGKADILIGGKAGDKNTINALNNGIEFNEDVSGNALVEISHNDIDSTLSGIRFEGDVSNVAAGGVSQEEILITNNDIDIYGAGSGINFAGNVSDNRHDTRIANNDILVRDGFFDSGKHAIHFEGDVNDASVWIVDNDRLYGNQDGIAFDGDIENNGRVRIHNNTSIIGEDQDGIDFSGDITSGSFVSVNGNDEIKGQTSGIQSSFDNGIEIAGLNDGRIQILNNVDIAAADHGIAIFGDITNGSDVDIHDNIIMSNTDGGRDGAGIWFDGEVTNSTINIGDGALNSNPSNIITVGSTRFSNASGLDGIHFDDTVGTGAEVLIDGNRIGDEKEGITDDGIQFAAVNGDAVVDITDNRIYANDDGVFFIDEVSGSAKITIGETKTDADGNVINAGDDAIEFFDDVTGASQIIILKNELFARDNGIEFSGETSNAVATPVPEGDISADIFIGQNDIYGTNNGISFEGEASGRNHAIRITRNTINGDNGNGIQHTGGISGAKLRIINNQSIMGDENGILVEGSMGTEGSRKAFIEVSRNDLIQGGSGDGVHIEDYGFSGANIELVENKIEFGQDGIEVSAYSAEVLVDQNEISNAGQNGILLNAKGSLFIESPETDFETTAFLVDNTQNIANGPRAIAFVSTGFDGEFNSVTSNNIVTESGSNGLNVQGETHDSVVVEGNTFTDNLTGARFESGAVDVSNVDNPNIFEVTPDFVVPTDEFVTGMQFELANSGAPTSLTIVDETFGTTEFTGFSALPVNDAFYARLEDGAILDALGNVIEIDGTFSSWDGLVPNAQGNILSATDLAVIENRLFDADDSPANQRGQIFVGRVPQGLENIEDFFQEFDQFGGAFNGLNVRLLGLPSIGGAGGAAPFSLANIEPAAGEEGSDPESLANLEPAAGGDDASAACWGDAVNAAASGAPVSYDFGGSFEESLVDASSCGAQQ